LAAHDQRALDVLAGGERRHQVEVLEDEAGTARDGSHRSLPGICARFAAPPLTRIKELRRVAYQQRAATVAKRLAAAQYFDYHRIMEDQEAVRSLAALAQGMRLKVFRALVVAGSEGLTPGALTEALDVAPATLSFHLKELAHAGLVTQERVSRNLIYRASFEQMNALLAYLTDNCCQGEACLEPAAAACKC
jgi:ArsR family transcriptional regulator